MGRALPAHGRGRRFNSFPRLPSSSARIAAASQSGNEPASASRTEAAELAQVRYDIPNRELFRQARTCRPDDVVLGQRLVLAFRRFSDRLLIRAAPASVLF